MRATVTGLGILLSAVIFISAYSNSETVRSEPERNPTYVSPGNGLERSEMELLRKFQQKNIVIDNRLYELDPEQEAERIHQAQALLLSIEEEPEPEPTITVEVASEVYEDVWITSVELQAYLDQSDWPEVLHQSFTNIVSCESGVYDPITGDYIFNVNARGDYGLAWGLGQIRIDAHPEKVQRYNLLQALPNLNASYLIYEEAGSSFWPWSCSPNYIGSR